MCRCGTAPWKKGEKKIYRLIWIFLLPFLSPFPLRTYSNILTRFYGHFYPFLSVGKVSTWSTVRPGSSNRWKGRLNWASSFPPLGSAVPFQTTATIGCWTRIIPTTRSCGHAKISTTKAFVNQLSIGSPYWLEFQSGWFHTLPFCFCPFVFVIIRIPLASESS